VTSADQTESPAAFISYAHEDRAIAHELAFGLQKRGCQVWIDAGELRAGDSLVERLADGIAHVDFVVAVVSHHSVESSWCAKELSFAMTQEIDLKGRFGVRRVLPLRVGAVQMPPLLRDKFYLDVDRDRPGDLVPRLWEDIAGHVTVGDPTLSPFVGDDAQRAFELGVNLYRKGELAAARRHLHDASQESHHAAALLLGEILYTDGDVKKAADELQFAAGSDDVELANAAVIQYGRLFVEQEFSGPSPVGDSRGALIGGRSGVDAEGLWRRAAESEHRDAAWAWLGLGRLREDPPPPGGNADPDPEGAEDAYGRAARCGHSASHSYALLKLGLAKWKLQKVDEAIPILEVGATSDNAVLASMCAFHLGRLYWKCRQDEEAFRWWYAAASADKSDISEQARKAIDDPSSIWRLR
jgi:TPR repeat protein